MAVSARMLLFLIACCAFSLGSAGAARPEHVVIISIDGGRPAVLQQSCMPNLQKLVSEGAHTCQATTTDPSTTLPSHTSMLTGVTPAKHKLRWNRWRPQKGAVRVPTVFALAKKAGLKTAMFVGKIKFQHLLQTNTLDKFSYVATPSRSAADTEQTFAASAVLPPLIARDAAAWLVREKPNLCFIHFAEPDAAGHRHRWGSVQQMQAFANVDAGIGMILQSLEAGDMTRKSVVIVTADHGGHGRRHGSKRPDDKLIPWIAWGEGVKHGLAIEQPVTTCDTTATALWLLQVPQELSLDGKPVQAAFE
jgi:predicted AlkP superfamily pyrophosphatase or phosphodiesterase